MAKKRTKNAKPIAQEALAKEVKEKIDNFMVFSTIAVFLLAVLLMMLCNLGHNFRYVLAVQTIEKALMWLGVIGTGFFAVYSAIAKKRLYWLCAVCASLAAMMFAVYHIDGSAFHISGYGFAYIMMGLYLIFVYVFCWLAESGRYKKKQTAKRFRVIAAASVCALMALIIAAYAIQMQKARSYREGYTGPALTPVTQSSDVAFDEDVPQAASQEEIAEEETEAPAEEEAAPEPETEENTETE